MRSAFLKHGASLPPRQARMWLLGPDTECQIRFGRRPQSRFMEFQIILCVCECRVPLSATNVTGPSSLPELACELSDTGDLCPENLMGYS